METIKPIEIETSEMLISRLEEFAQSKNGYVFRGQPDSKFLLTPNSFRPSSLKILSENFKVPWQEWSASDELSRQIQPAMRIITPSVSKLVAFIQQYNFRLAQYVEQNEPKFDDETRKMYEVRKSDFWCKKEVFFDLSIRMHMSLTARVDLRGKVLNYSDIHEDLAGYDETLPQHYSVPTAALDWTRNPYKAIYFSLQGIPENATQISLYAFREVKSHPDNPIFLREPTQGCQNERVKAQEGLFSYIKTGTVFLNYIISDFHQGTGTWLTIDHCVPKNRDNFEVIKFNVPVNCFNKLNDMLALKNINAKTLCLES